MDDSFGFIRGSFFDRRRNHVNEIGISPSEEESLLTRRNNERTRQQNGLIRQDGFVRQGELIRQDGLIRQELRQDGLIRQGLRQDGLIRQDGLFRQQGGLTIQESERPGSVRYSRAESSRCGSVSGRSKRSNSFEVVYKADVEWDSDSELTEDIFIEMLKRRIEQRKSLEEMRRKTRKGVPRRPRHRSPTIIQAKQENTTLRAISDVVAIVCTICSISYAVFVIYKTYMKVV